MSKLLFKLRQQILETSTTTTIACYGAAGTRRRHRNNDPVNGLVVHAAAKPDDEQLQESAALMVEARSHLRFMRSTGHSLYTSVMRDLSESVESGNISAELVYDCYDRLEPLLETGAVEPPAGQDIHAKFLKALAKEFGVEFISHTPINEGVFVHLSDEESHKLAASINEVRDFAESHKYLVLRKGTFSSGSDQTWVFVVEPNLDSAPGECHDKW